MKIDALMLAVTLALCPGVSFAQTASPAATVHDAQTVAAGDATAPAGSDPQATAAADSAERAWQAYQDSLVDALINSDRPRDWMLAANMIVFSSDSGKPLRPTRDELLERATSRAPDDVLVQWIAALDRSGGTTCVARPVPDENVEALTRLQPDNAASWMMALALASARKNPALVDDPLAHMASSARYDDHFADILHAWVDFYDRFPPHPSLQAAYYAAKPTQPLPAAWQSMLSSASALAQAAATAMPTYKALITACKPGKSDSDSWQRHAYCEDAGRLMLDKGETLIARSIGFAVLRNLGSFTAADQQKRRNLDWYMHAGIELFSDDARDADALAAYQADWRNLDDEIEVIKRALRRAGLPDEAPAGWAGSSWSSQNTPKS